MLYIVLDYARAYNPLDQLVTFYTGNTETSNEVQIRVCILADDKLVTRDDKPFYG